MFGTARRSVPVASTRGCVLHTKSANVSDLNRHCVRLSLAIPTEDRRQGGILGAGTDEGC
jgi:hypothetical protein